MAIERSSERIKAPGLHNGVYVDPSLRSTKAYGPDCRIDDLGGADNDKNTGVNGVDSFDESSVDEDFPRLGYDSSWGGIPVLNDVRQSVFGVDADAIAIAESLKSSGEFDFDGIHVGELALSNNSDLDVAQMDALLGSRDEVEEVIAHLGRKDLIQDICINIVEGVRGDVIGGNSAPLPHATAMALGREAVCDGVSDLREIMNMMIPPNAPSRLKRDPVLMHRLMPKTDATVEPIGFDEFRDVGGYTAWVGK